VPRLILILLLTLAGCSGIGILNTLSRSSGPVERDVAYGPLERHRLDIYRPAGGKTDAPVLMFVHGGSWQTGSKDDYPFLGSAFAKAGIETVVVNYRLYPDVIYPAMTADVAKAIVYAKRQIADKRPLFLMGHSAGAHLAALATIDPAYLAAEGTDTCSAVSGFVGLAGPYDFTLTDDKLKKIFPAPIREAGKPVIHANRRLPPALLLHGDADTTVPSRRSRQLIDVIRQAGNEATLTIYGDVDHLYILGAVSPIIRHKAPSLSDTIDFIDKEEAKGFPGCGRNGF
jgi:acetyl esterase/lipase